MVVTAAGWVLTVGVIVALLGFDLWLATMRPHAVGYRMATFAVPAEHQQRVLTFGIIAALALRAVFIALGAALLSLLSFKFLVFGLLLWTAVLAVTTVTSLIKSRRDPGARAHAGAVIGAPPRAAPDKERQPAAASHRPGLTEPSRTRCCAPGAARRRTPAHHHSVLTRPAPALGCMDGERAGYRVERQPRSSIGVTPPGQQP